MELKLAELANFLAELYNFTQSKARDKTGYVKDVLQKFDVTNSVVEVEEIAQ